MIASAKDESEKSSADLRFVLDKLSARNKARVESFVVGRLDLDRVAVVGHSAGGTAAVRACHGGHAMENGGKSAISQQKVSATTPMDATLVAGGGTNQEPGALRANPSSPS
jgi:predicted dienelactone hydrolase